MEDAVDTDHFREESRESQSVANSAQPGLELQQSDKYYNLHYEQLNTQKQIQKREGQRTKGVSLIRTHIATSHCNTRIKCWNKTCNH